MSDETTEAERAEALEQGVDQDAPRDEGDVAADYLEELLDICDLDGDIDIDEHDDRVFLTVGSSEDAGLSVLSKPETVSALQELTRLTVQSETGEFSRLILDIGGSRDKRRGELAGLVRRSIERIEAGASEASLPAMSSYERKIVHDLVAEEGYVSASRGEGSERHTVITAS